MQRSRSLTAVRWTLALVLMAAAAWLFTLNLAPKSNDQELRVPPLAQQGSAAQPTMLRALPPAEATGEPTPVYTLPPEDPTETPAPNTPTPVPLQAAVLVTPSSVTGVSLDSALFLSEKSTVNTAEAISSLVWAPTGDKLVYITNAGNLYWSNPDGSNATLLHSYGETFYGPLDQQPMTNTLFVPGYAIHFVPGQNPTLEAAAATYLSQIRWWSPDRASGIASVSYAPGGYVGGDKLVTIDATGHLIEERNIPYIWTGAVRPGGQWLAYSTNQQATDTPFYGSDPQTTYLLNLQTGQRLQITAPGEGPDVYSWSPDGSWFLMRGCRNNTCGSMLVSADGLEVVIVDPNAGWGMWDAVWSRDSKHLAFSHQGGGCEDPNQPCAPYSSEVIIVDVPARKAVNLDTEGFAATATGMMMHPAWSPDGSLLALLSYDPDCLPLCSGTAPAVYVMTTTK